MTAPENFWRYEALEFYLKKEEDLLILFPSYFCCLSSFLLVYGIFVILYLSVSMDSLN